MDEARFAASNLTIALALTVVLVALSFVQAGFSQRPDIRLNAMRAVVDSQRTNLGDPRPSIEAAWRLRLDSRAAIYDAERTEGAAFIYPPLAAIFYTPLVSMSREGARDWLARINRLLLAGIAFCALLLLREGGPLRPWQLLGTCGALVLFYPLLRAVELNQASVVVSFAIGLSLVLLDRGRERAAGVCFALAFLFKPHLALALPLLLWHARAMVVWSLSTGAALFVVSLLYAGTANHVDYLTEMLPVVSRGYAFYPNHSWNGVLHRLSADADIVHFVIAPGSIFVRVGSMTLGLVIYVAALLSVRRWRGAAIRPGLLLAFAWLTATLVSPVAWEHHYAPALFLFAMAASLWHREPACVGARLALLLGLAFGLIASYFEVRDLTSPLSRLLVSYVFVGAWLLWGAWLLLLATPASRAEPAR